VWEQFIDAAVQMRGQSGQHVVKVRVRVVAIDLCRLHEAHDDGSALAGKLTAREQPCFSSERNHSAASTLRGDAGRAPLCGMRPRQPFDCRTAREEPGVGAAACTGMPAARRHSWRMGRRGAGVRPPNTFTTRASAVSVPARMSIGSVASHTASTRINAATRAARLRTTTLIPPASAPLRRRCLASVRCGCHGPASRLRAAHRAR
jgi:hypothetical protein